MAGTGDPGDVTTDVDCSTVLTATRTEDGSWIGDENVTGGSSMRQEIFIWSVIDHAIAQYVTPIIAGTGTLGNCLCIVVLLSQYFKKSAASVLLIQQSLIDIGYLSLVIFPYILGSEAFFLLPGQSFIGCLMFTFLKHLFFVLSSWNLVLISIDRLLVVYFPLKMLKARSRSKVYLVWCIMFVLAVLCVSSNFIIFETRNDSDAATDVIGYGNCKLKEQYFTFIRIWALVFPVIIFWIPLFIIMMTNALILAKIKASSYKGYLFGDNPQHTSDNKQFLAKREATFTSLALHLGLVFFLTNAPLNTVFLLYRSEVIPVSTVEDFAIEYMVFTLFETIAMLNSTLNIFLYYLSGKTFRQAAAHRLTFCRHSS